MEVLCGVLSMDVPFLELRDGIISVPKAFYVSEINNGIIGAKTDNRIKNYRFSREGHEVDNLLGKEKRLLLITSEKQFIRLEAEGTAALKLHRGCKKGEQVLLSGEWTRDKKKFKVYQVGRYIPISGKLDTE